MEKIFGFFKTKNVDSVIKYFELPFTLSVGSMFDDANIKDFNILKSKFQKLFKQNYFSLFLNKKISNTKNSVNFQTHSYNKEGEMESESSMMFNFKNNKGGKSYPGLIILEELTTKNILNAIENLADMGYFKLFTGYSSLPEEGRFISKWFVEGTSFKGDNIGIVKLRE